jgi:hypothetical protein
MHHVLLRSFDHVEAAINAIVSRNHHYWLDRDDNGRVFVSVWPETSPRRIVTAQPMSDRAKRAHATATALPYPSG